MEERKSRLFGDIVCAQQPSPPTGDLEDIAGVNGLNGKGMVSGR